VQMRFMELIVRVATLNEKSFEFVKSSGLLHQAVELYNTPDVLLKLNIAEVMEQFGESSWTIQFLKDDEQVWKLIQKEAFVLIANDSGRRHRVLCEEVSGSADHQNAFDGLLQVYSGDL